MKQLFSAAILALLMLCGASPARAALIGFSGPSAVQAGTQFDVGIRVDDISALYAYNLSVRYDPLALRFVAQSEGAFLQAGGAAYFIEGAVDAAAGMISFTGASLIGPHQGVTGGGMLFTLTFAALEVADMTLASFSLQDALFVDAAIEEIGVALVPAYGVRILGGEGQVPEPAVPALLLAGAAAMAIGRRRRVTCRGA